MADLRTTLAVGAAALVGVTLAANAITPTIGIDDSTRLVPERIEHVVTVNATLDIRGLDQLKPGLIVPRDVDVSGNVRLEVAELVGRLVTTVLGIPSQYRHVVEERSDGGQDEPLPIP